MGQRVSIQTQIQHLEQQRQSVGRLSRMTTTIQNYIETKLFKRKEPELKRQERTNRPGFFKKPTKLICVNITQRSVFHVFSPQVNNLVCSFGCGYSLLFFILTNCQSGRPVSFFLVLLCLIRLSFWHFISMQMSTFTCITDWSFYIIIKNKKIVE